MTSQINPTVPPSDTQMLSAPIRQNFATAAVEITALVQDAVGVTASSLPQNVTVNWPDLPAAQQSKLIGAVTSTAAGAANTGDVNVALQLVGGAACAPAVPSSSPAALGRPFVPK